MPRCANQRWQTSTQQIPRADGSHVSADHSKNRGEAGCKCQAMTRANGISSVAQVSSAAVPEQDPLPVRLTVRQEECWLRIRTTQSIKCVFGRWHQHGAEQGERHRVARLTMMFKSAESASRKRRRPQVSELIRDVVASV